MRQGFAYTLAVVGVVAAVAVIALNDAPSSQQLMFRDTDSNDIDFQHYIAQFGKAYSSKDEYDFRLKQYKANMARINTHNAGNADSYHLKPNRFADMTHEEYKQLLGFRPNNKTVLRPAPLKVATDLPASIDWRAKGAVNAVKDQAQCGSCWAFSTVASLEGRNFVKTGKLQSLSEQQLVDCDRADGNQGCNGGDMGTAMTYIHSSPLESEGDYPYEAVDQTCSVVKSKEIVGDKAPFAVTPNSKSALMAAVAEGPVSVAIEADTMVFQFYAGGVFDNTECGTNLDHGVAVVGYGNDGKQDYYIVRNSWGSSWGESGYIKIAAPGDGPGICGIQMQPVYPQV